MNSAEVNLSFPSLICTNMADIEEQSVDDDPDFNDSDNDVYCDDDILFYHNITKGIEMDIHSILEDEEAPDLDSSSYASSKELNFGSCSDSEENSIRMTVPEHRGGNEKKNPLLEVGLLYASFNELKDVLRIYAVFNWIEPIFKRNDKDGSIVFTKMDTHGSCGSLNYKV